MKAEVATGSRAVTEDRAAQSELAADKDDEDDEDDDTKGEEDIAKRLLTAPDDSLKALVDLTAILQGQLSLPITLMLQGSLVDGVIVPGSTWFPALVEMARTDDGDESAEAIKLLFQTEIEFYSRELGEGERPRHSFLHLSDATVATGTALYKIRLLRVRLSEISAWTLGRPEH
jgi:hypothetical protein